jgi:uncharacterized protein (TIGR03435 family)
MSPLPPGERVSFTNVTLRSMLQIAYAGAFVQITGLPAWAGAAGPPTSAMLRFDVNAKAEAPSTHEQLVTMLRALLADRFKLAAHIEAYEEPVYALVVTRADGRLGPGLHPDTSDCESRRAAAREQGAGADPCGVPPSGMGRVVARSKTIDLLAAILRPLLDRPVVNKTGLTGLYDWEFTLPPPRTVVSTANGDQSLDQGGLSVFTAVQEQLGLKLQPEKDDQPVLVIDHVEQPTPD